MIARVVSSYDPQAEVKLFGSQARDYAAGGDIDLLILSSRIDLSERLQIESDLQDVFGMRRFDIVVVADMALWTPLSSLSVMKRSLYEPPGHNVRNVQTLPPMDAGIAESCRRSR